MAFLTVNNSVVSFAEYQDALDTDQRLFEQNEGLTEDTIEDRLVRSTQRILDRIRVSDWWRSYYAGRNSGVTRVEDIPSPSADLIQGRQDDFTDLCVYGALYEYILPKIADFSAEDNAERAKMGYYQAKYDSLLGELLIAGDWYDFDNSGAVAATEKSAGTYNIKRIR